MVCNEYWLGEKKRNESIFYSAVKMGALWDKQILKHIPISYTLPKGTIFTIKRLVYKDNRNLPTKKHSFVELILNGKTLIVLKEDFNNMDIDNVKK